MKHPTRIAVLFFIVVSAIASPSADANLFKFVQACFKREDKAAREKEQRLAEFRAYRDRKPPSLHGLSQEEENKLYNQAIKNLPEKNNKRFVHVALVPLRTINTGKLPNLPGKEDGDAARNLFRHMFLENIHKDPILRSYLLHQFIDYKDMELMFNDVEQDKIMLFEGHLHGAYRDALMEFDPKLRAYIAPDMEEMQIFLQQPGVVSDVRAWHQAAMGIGHPDYAAAQTRFMEFDPERPSPLVVQRFDVPKAHHFLEESEATRLKIAQTKKNSPWLQRYETTEDYVLSRGALEIIRPLKDMPKDEAIKIIMQQAREYMGVNLSQSEAETSLKYFIAANRFQPPLRNVEPVVFRYESAVRGLLTVDFAGQGHVNANHTMGALIAASKLPERQGVKAIELSTIYDAAATARLKSLQSKFKAAMRAAGIKGEAVFSGDDGACALPEEITPAQYKAMLVHLAATPELADFRTVYSPKASRPPTSTDHVRAEKFEKSLREKLKPKLFSNRLSMFSFSSYVDLDTGKMQLFVGGKPSPAEMLEIRRIAEAQSPYDGLVLESLTAL